MRNALTDQRISKYTKKHVEEKKGRSQRKNRRQQRQWHLNNHSSN